MKSNSIFALLIATLLTSMSWAQDLIPTSINSTLPSQQGNTINISVVVENQGVVSSGTSEIRIYLSDRCGLGGTKIALGTDQIGVLSPNGSEVGQISWTIPENFKPGSYHLYAEIDHLNQVVETNESNNTICKGATVRLSSQTINNNFDRSKQILPSRGLRYPSIERRSYYSDCPPINRAYNGSSVKRNWIPSVSSCRNLTYQNSILLAEFKLPNGKTMSDVSRIRLILKGNTPNNSSGSSFDLFDVFVQQGNTVGTYREQYSRGLAKPKLHNFSGVIGRDGSIDESEIIPTHVFNANDQTIYIMIRSRIDRTEYNFTEVSCEVELKVPVAPGCSSTGWWREFLSSSGSHIVKDQLYTNRHKDIMFRTVNNKVGVAVKQPFGDYKFIELGSNLNYTVASNIVTNSADETFFQSPSNDLMRLYWDVTTSGWAISNMNNVADHACGGHLAIHNDKVFYKTTYSHINAVYFDGTNWVRDLLNNVNPKGCAGHLEINSSGQVFYRDYNHMLRCLYLNGNQWTYSELGNVGVDCLGYLAINGNDQVFYRGTAGFVHCVYWNGNGWSQVNNLATGVKGDLSIGTDDKVFFAKKYHGWDHPRIQYLEWTNGNWVTKWAPIAKDGLVSNLMGGNVLATGFQNEVFYVQDGGKMGRLYYGVGVGCDPSRKKADNLEQEADNYQLDDETILSSDFRQSATIYPNPSTGIFNLKVENVDKIEFQVYNITGKLVMESSMNENARTINLSGLNSGIYFLHLNYGNKSERVKLIKN